MHAANERVTLAGVTMVEPSVSVRPMSEVADPAPRQHLRNILTGAQWRGDALAKAGLADDAVC
eukprot:6851778-Lingulodinium_polyedra.AAC.1